MFCSSKNSNNRPFGIGGSDIAAVLGLSPYKSPLELWCDIVGRSVPYKKDQLHLRFGQFAEQFIAREYELRTGLHTHIHQDALFHPRYEFIFGHIDRFVSSHPDEVCIKEGKVICNKLLECKTASAFNRLEWGEDGSSEVPAPYLLQCIWYLAITDCEQADVAVLIGNNDLRLFTIKRDFELEDMVISHAKLFWNEHVLPKVPPPASCTADAQILYPKETTDKCVEADSLILESLNDFIEKSNQIKSMNTECDRLKTEILSYMGHSEKLTHDGKTLATWKSSKSSQRLDAKALGNAHPAIASQFMQTVLGSRRFLVKGLS